MRERERERENSPNIFVGAGTGWAKAEEVLLYHTCLLAREGLQATISSSTGTPRNEARGYVILFNILSMSYAW